MQLKWKNGQMGEFLQFCVKIRSQQIFLERGAGQRGSGRAKAINLHLSIIIFK